MVSGLSSKMARDGPWASRDQGPTGQGMCPRGRLWFPGALIGPWVPGPYAGLQAWGRIGHWALWPTFAGYFAKGSAEELKAAEAEGLMVFMALHSLAEGLKLGLAAM